LLRRARAISRVLRAVAWVPALLAASAAADPVVFTSSPPTSVEENAQLRYVLRAVDVGLESGDDEDDEADDRDNADDDRNDADDNRDRDEDDRERDDDRNRDDDDRNRDDERERGIDREGGNDDRGRGNGDRGRGRGRGRGGDDKHLAIVYAAPILPAWLTFDGEDTLRGRPRSQDRGAHAVRVTASNGRFTAVQNFQITVTAAAARPRPPSAPPTAALAGWIAVAPNPVDAGAPAEWTFAVENRSEVDVANLSIRAQLQSSGALEVGTPEGAECTIDRVAAGAVLECRAAPLVRNESLSMTIDTTSAVAADIEGTVTVAILDTVPRDGDAGNDSASATLTVMEQIGGRPIQRLEVNGARAAAAGDFDGDGMNDLAVSDDDGVWLFPGMVDPNEPSKRVLATEPAALASTTGLSALVAADLDGDGDLDLVGAGASDAVLLNAGARPFEPIELEGLGGASRAVAIGDLDGDGQADIVIAKDDTTVIHRNIGGANFVLDAHLGSGGRSVGVADLFGDGSAEIVLAGANGETMLYRRSNARFEQAAMLSTGSAVSVGAADLDGDGDRDLLFGRAAGGARLYRNDSTDFTRAAELAASGSAAVLAADLDGDSVTDVLTVNAVGGHLLHVNDRSSRLTFTPRAERFAFAAARSAVLGKLSVDERYDVAVVTAKAVGIFFNDGTGGFGAGDTGAPTLTLNGEPRLALTVGAAFRDPGVTAIDAVDGDLSGQVVVQNPVDPSVIGTYTVTYAVADRSGNPAVPVTRTVEVRPQDPSGGGGGGSVGAELALLCGLWLLARAAAASRVTTRDSARARAAPGSARSAAGRRLAR
jgi:hypothetical protein